MIVGTGSSADFGTLFVLFETTNGALTSRHFHATPVALHASQPVPSQSSHSAEYSSCFVQASQVTRMVRPGSVVNGSATERRPIPRHSGHVSCFASVTAAIACSPRFDAVIVPSGSSADFASFPPPPYVFAFMMIGVTTAWSRDVVSAPIGSSAECTGMVELRKNDLELAILTLGTGRLA